MTTPSDAEQPRERPIEPATAAIAEYSDASDCTLCSFAAPFVTEAECACWGCKHVPMSIDRCEAIAASHRTVCATWERTHACPTERHCDTMSIPACHASRCGATRVHLEG